MDEEPEKVKGLYETEVVLSNKDKSGDDVHFTMKELSKALDETGYPGVEDCDGNEVEYDQEGKMEDDEEMAEFNKPLRNLKQRDYDRIQSSSYSDTIVNDVKQLKSLLQKASFINDMEIVASTSPDYIALSVSFKNACRTPIIKTNSKYLSVFSSCLLTYYDGILMKEASNGTHYGWGTRTENWIIECFTDVDTKIKKDAGKTVIDSDFVSTTHKHDKGSLIIDQTTANLLALNEHDGMGYESSNFEMTYDPFYKAITQIRVLISCKQENWNDVIRNFLIVENDISSFRQAFMKELEENAEKVERALVSE